MKRLLLALSIVVLLASLVIHLLTFSAAPPLPAPLLFLMDIAVLAIFSAAFYFARDEFPARRRLSFSVGAIASQYQEVWRFYGRFLRPVPLWARVLFVVLAAYVGFNFNANLPPPDFSSLKTSSGRYYEVKKNGSSIELTKSNYEERRRQEARLFSGHWLIFSLVPVLFFAFIAPTLDKKEERQE